MASIGIGNLLASRAQSLGWQALNQVVNSKSRFGIFDANGNPFYAANVKKTDIPIFSKVFEFISSDNTSEAGVISFNYSKNYSVSTAPVEGGKTIAYGLVEQPRQGQVTYVSTGTEKQRNAFESALEQAESSLILYTLHTSERMIQNIKLTGHSVTRSASQGSQMIQYQITFQEVLITFKVSTLSNSTATYQNSQAQGVLEVSSPTGNQSQAAKKMQKVA